MRICKVKTGIPVGVADRKKKQAKLLDFRLLNIPLGGCCDYTFAKGEWHERIRILVLNRAERLNITVITKTFKRGKRTVLRIWVTCLHRKKNNQNKQVTS